jgi:hypothetical protein
MGLSRLDEALDQVNEGLQFGPNEHSGFIDLYPAPLPHAGFQPMVEHHSHTHPVDFNHISFVGTVKVVTAQRLAFQIANKAGFLLGFSDGCIPRLLTLLEGTLGDNPPSATQRCDKGDFNTFVADAKRDHGCLSIKSPHGTILQ